MEGDLLNRFVDQVIEGYLFGDLRTMAVATPTVPPPFGGIGYPMLATTAAGIELLGLLLMPTGSRFDPNEGRKHFTNYWNEYLVPARPAYGGLGVLFYQLIRHGIAHSFSAKGNILVTRAFRPSISLDRQTPALHIDCIGFYEDFEASYRRRAEAILGGRSPSPNTSVDQIRAMLDGLLGDQTKKAVAEFARLAPGLDSASNRPVAHILLEEGPNGPTGPSGYTGGTITPT
jgi:hypothetical protein